MITRSNDALRAQAKELRQAASALGIVDFNERKQEFFCRACRYRDPLGPAGNKLHDDECPYLHFFNVLESLDAALVAARDEGQPSASVFGNIRSVAARLKRNHPGDKDVAEGCDLIMALAKWPLPSREQE